MSSKRTGRNTFYSRSDWKLVSSKVRKSWLAMNKPCAYCGESLVGQRVVVDHILNRTQRPDLALDPTNLQVLHRKCNSVKYYHVEINDKVETTYDGYPKDSEWTE